MLVRNDTSFINYIFRISKNFIKLRHCALLCSFPMYKALCSQTFKLHEESLHNPATLHLSNPILHIL